MTNRYKIDGDCQDDTLMQQTYSDLCKIMSYLSGASEKVTKIKISIYNHLYEIDEQRFPDYWENRFALCKHMVKNIKDNKDGQFDHNPLNITARRIDYFMKNREMLMETM